MAHLLRSLACRDVDVEITPEPSEDERAAILAALRDDDNASSAWADMALAEREEFERP
jgi:hypothetical protein